MSKIIARGEYSADIIQLIANYLEKELPNYTGNGEQVIVEIVKPLTKG